MPGSSLRPRRPYAGIASFHCQDKDGAIIDPSGPYHHGDLPAALLAAVEAQIRDRGVASVGLRETARRAGVSHAAPAHHFGDMRGLLTAFAVQGQRLLSAGMDEAEQAAGASPVERLVATAVGYATFGVEHRAHFEVMGRLDVIDRDDPELRAVGQSNFDRLLHAVIDHQQSGWRRHDDPVAVAVMLWSSVHGLVTLWLGGFVEDRLRADGIAAFTRSMVGPLVDLS